MGEGAGARVRDGAASLNQRLAALLRRERGNRALNIVHGFRIDGPLDVSAFNEAVRLVSLRHEAVRTSLSGTGPRMRQSVGGRPAEVDFRTETGLADMAGARMLQEELSTPFDLEHEHAFRFRLRSLGPSSHLFAVTADHLCADSWSMTVLLRDLGRLYAQIITGQQVDPHQPAVRMQQLDFSEQQLASHTAGRLAAAQRYWTEALNEARSVTLGLDDEDPSAMEAASSRTEVFAGRAGLGQALRTAARTRHTSPAAILFAALASHLRDIGADGDSVVTFFANRADVDRANTVGFLATCLLFRLPCKENTPDTLIAQCSERLLAAFRHQELPYPLVRLTDGRRLRPALLFQVLGMPARHLVLPGVTTHELTPHATTTPTRFPIELHMEIEDAEIRLRSLRAHTAGPAWSRFAEGYMTTLTQLVERLS